MCTYIVRFRSRRRRNSNNRRNSRNIRRKIRRRRVVEIMIEMVVGNYSIGGGLGKREPGL